MSYPFLETCEPMTNLNSPFHLNVGFIAHEDVGYSREFTFEFDQIQISDDLTLRQFKGAATFGRTPQGLIVQGNFSAATTLECARCLTQIEQKIAWKLTELYAFKEKSASESELIMPEDGHIDLEPLIREYALLELTINPVCKADCKGLCIVCGEDLNNSDCGHNEDITNNSPFAALKDLLEE